MARYTGPVCRYIRSYYDDSSGDALILDSLKSGVRPLKEKCRLKNRPGQHASKKNRLSDYGVQLRQKQILKLQYGVLERQFHRYYEMALRKKGDTGEILLQILESRLDNVVYRIGFAVTRAEARQLVGHRSIAVNGKMINIPSYQVKPGDVIEIRSHSRTQTRILAAIDLAQKRETADWVTQNFSEFSGRLARMPVLHDFPESYKVQLVVEYYSR